MHATGRKVRTTCRCASSSDCRRGLYHDLSARNLQKREKQWTRAKGFDNSAPYGPWITTADEIPDPGALALKTWVNGELRQDSSTSDLIFGVEEIVRFLTETCTLEPGDLLGSGTQSGPAPQEVWRPMF